MHRRPAWRDAPFIKPHITGRYETEPYNESWKRFWDAWNLLVRLGLIEGVGHLIEADTADAEVIHSYPLGETGEAVERRLAAMADAAGRALITEGQYEWAASQLGSTAWLAPVPAHITNVALVEIARLRYRPRTAATAAWHAELHEKAKAMLQRYEAIIGVATLNPKRVAASCSSQSFSRSGLMGVL